MAGAIKKPTDAEFIAYLRRQEQSLFGLACSVMSDDMERCERILKEVAMLESIADRFEELVKMDKGDSEHDTKI